MENKTIFGSSAFIIRSYRKPQKRGSLKNHYNYVTITSIDYKYVETRLEMENNR
jgi:hypothetical protein